jgi:two-component system response regulator AtoC
MSKEAQRALLEYSYPGNVRELSNILEHAMVLTDDDTIEFDDLPREIKGYQIREMGRNNNIYKENLLGLSLKEVETMLIRATLIDNNGNKKKSAEILGISERGLYNKTKKYNIEI